MDITCYSCSKIIKTKYITCDHCKNHYHPSCTVLKPVHNKNNKLVNACRSCIAAANTKNRRSDSVDESNANNSLAAISTSTSLSTSSLHPPLSPNDPLQQILNKLSKLDTLDTRLSTLSSSLDARFDQVQTTLNTRLEEVSTRMTNLEEKLLPLDDLPLLSSRLSAAEEAITQMQSEQANLRRQYEELCTTNSAAALDVSSMKRIEKLEYDYRHLNTAQQNLSNELVMTGLPITDPTSLNGAVYAALKLLDVGLLQSDIRHVRKMHLKPPSEPPNHTTPVTEEEVAVELQDGHAEKSPTIAPQTSSQSTSTDTRPRFAPLIVTLSSHSLAVSLINAKTRHLA